ncbi:DNAase [Vibrio sinaloensis]|uniref:DNAase n=1 Tax=Photobacterium sp. (strain ATCC 43367) TaxID=379097 RepID=UPI002F3F27CA
MIVCVTENPEALARLKVAFRACPQDFEELKAEVQTGRVSLYQLTGEGYDITVAGEILGESYYLWGVSGYGVIQGIRELQTYVKNAGLTSISAETYFPALARLVRRLNTTEKPLTDTTHLLPKAQ